MQSAKPRSLFTFIPAAPIGSSTWLLHLRWFATAGQLITIAFAALVIGLEMNYGALTCLVVVTALTNLVYAWWLRRNQLAELPSVNGAEAVDQDSLDSSDAVAEPDALEFQPHASQREAGWRVQLVALGLMLLDLITLTVMLYFSGGAANPFSFFYFVNLAVGAVMIRPSATWSLAAVATVGYTVVLFFYQPVEDLGQIFPNHLGLRTIGLMLAFVTCASVVTYFVSRTSGLLRARERQLRESQLAQAADRRLEALTTLAAGAAHELATPLSTIDVIARELTRHLESVPKPATVDQDLKLIDHQLDLCRHILQRMRGAAGDSMAQQWYETTVGDLIDATLEGIRDPHRVDVIDNSEEVENETLWMPEEAVAQAVRNLIHNGLDASGADGRVRVESRLDQGNVEFIITDQGEGMDVETLRRIGDPFFTTKEPGRGIGLGLYLTRNVISQLGGTLDFKSIPGQGTRATASLPVSNPQNHQA